MIGSAGRGSDKTLISLDLYKEMMHKIHTTSMVVRMEHGLEIDCLVSGGAAWADHTAVHRFVLGMIGKLELYLPCPFDFEAKKFHERDADGRLQSGSTGGVANHYHRCFSQKLNFDSLAMLAAALEMPGCKSHVSNGFKPRNTKVAEAADALLAMTFGYKQVVKDGGTADTVAKFLARPEHGPAYHMDLERKLCYRNARVA